MWTLEVGSDRGLGRPDEWNDNFSFKFSNWLSALPGDAERFLEESVKTAHPIVWATLATREKIVATGVSTALRAVVGGKPPSCIRHQEKRRGFVRGTKKVGLLERAMDDQSTPGGEVGKRFLKRSPKELRDHLALESPQLANVEKKFPVMREQLVALVSLTENLLCSEVANGYRRGKYHCGRCRCNCVCAWMVWIVARKGVTARERIERKAGVEEKGKAKGRKERRTGERKQGQEQRWEKKRWMVD